MSPCAYLRLPSTTDNLHVIFGQSPALIDQRIGHRTGHLSDVRVTSIVRCSTFMSLPLWRRSTVTSCVFGKAASTASALEMVVPVSVRHHKACDRFGAKGRRKAVQTESGTATQTQRVMGALRSPKLAAKRKKKEVSIHCHLLSGFLDSQAPPFSDRTYAI